jgi:hypothetical protein
LEHSSLRGRYFSAALIAQLNHREANDETRSDRYRKHGNFGPGRLGGGGECTVWRSRSSL